MTGLIDFSIDAISNDLGAPPINFQEGQPAGTLNNSSRAMMAALACWRDDNIGLLQAARGTGDAYALNTNQVFSAGTADTPGNVTRGHTLAFTVDVANQGPATLAPDGCPAKPLRRPLGREMAPGDLSPGIIYRVAFIPSLGAYILLSPELSAPGSYRWQAASAVPAGWLVPDGSAVSRTVYAALFAAIGTTYGQGDGATTFNLPNVVGRTLFAQDAAGAVLTAANGLAGTLGSIGGAATVTLLTKHLPSGNLTGSTSANGGHDHGGSVAAAGQHSHDGATGNAGGHSHTGATNGAGAHTHTGSTDPANHNHQYTTASIKNATAGSGNSATQLWAGNDTGAPDTITSISNTFTTSAVGDHAHGFVTNTVADHAHAIAADGSHSHPIAAVGDHQHTVAVSLGGQDAAHPNIPPGAVAVLLIKA